MEPLIHSDELTRIIDSEIARRRARSKFAVRMFFVGLGFAFGTLAGWIMARGPLLNSEFSRYLLTALLTSNAVLMLVFIGVVLLDAISNKRVTYAFDLSREEIMARIIAIENERGE